MLSVGKSDNVCGDVTYALHEYMTERGINHVFYDVDGEHENKVWQNSLYNFCKIFLIRSDSNEIITKTEIFFVV